MDRFASLTSGPLHYGLLRRWLEFVAVEADENNCLRRAPAVVTMRTSFMALPHEGGRVFVTTIIQTWQFLQKRNAIERDTLACRGQHNNSIGLMRSGRTPSTPQIR